MGHPRASLLRGAPNTIGSTRSPLAFKRATRYPEPMKTLIALLPVLMAAISASPAAAASQTAQHMLMPATNIKRVTSHFGYRHDGFHPGVDLSAPSGSQVRAALPGTVVFAGWDGEYGKLVALRSDNGIVTRYAHLSRIAPYVTMGRLLRTGASLGSVGMTGNASGPHLHFEVLVNCKPVDPDPYLWASRSVSGGDEKITEVAESPAMNRARTPGRHEVGRGSHRHP